MILNAHFFLTIAFRIYPIKKSVWQGIPEQRLDKNLLSLHPWSRRLGWLNIKLRQKLGFSLTMEKRRENSRKLIRAF